MNTQQFQQQLIGLQDNMMNFALKLTSDKDDAEDLLQDTTLRVLDNKDKYQDNTNFKGWVLTVMRNIFINSYHKIVRTHLLIDQNPDLYNLDVASEFAADSPENALRLVEITKAIESLNREVRIPFSLHLAGYKYHEIAKEMNVPVGTIKSRIFFARQQLQKKLADYLVSS